MASLLRKVRRARWVKTEYPWLTSSEFQADALDDLKTDKNILSLWFVKDIDDTVVLNRIIAALGANGDNLAVVDFVLIDEEKFIDLSLHLEEVAGDTKDQIVNNLHRDLVDLSGRNLFALAQLINDENNVKRVPKSDVARCIKASIASGFINSTEVNESILKKLK